MVLDKVSSWKGRNAAFPIRKCLPTPGDKLCLRPVCAGVFYHSSTLTGCRWRRHFEAWGCPALTGNSWKRPHTSKIIHVLLKMWCLIWDQFIAQEAMFFSVVTPKWKLLLMQTCPFLSQFNAAEMMTAYVSSLPGTWNFFWVTYRDASFWGSDLWKLLMYSILNEQAREVFPTSLLI